MKTLVKTRQQLEAVGRWDIDFHLPAEGIKKFPQSLLKRVDAVADIAKEKRDPGREPDVAFQYIDIAAVDVSIGSISNPQDVEGSDAPSRARKVVSAFDVIVSTCRPTRGAISVVPLHLHDQIASTAFSVLRPKAGLNPYYLHFALRLPSTLEQFRKWSTGSSYPAILDSDVKKTLIPVPEPSVQDAIAERVVLALIERERQIRAANSAWRGVLQDITNTLTGITEESSEPADLDSSVPMVFRESDIRKQLADLPTIRSDRRSADEEDSADLFGDAA